MSIEETSAYNAVAMPRVADEGTATRVMPHAIICLLA